MNRKLWIALAETEKELGLSADGKPVITDEMSAYQHLDKSKYNHIFVCHSGKEFVVGSYSTNGIEGFWGHFKRMVFSTYHFVSKAYLDRYIDESVYRWNTRELNEGDRFLDMFSKAIGKVQYRDVKISVAA